MRVLILADPGSSHTVKWANSLARRGVEIYLIGLSPFNPDKYEGTVRVESLARTASNFNERDSDVSKTKYLKLVPRIKEIIKTFEPDIVHAHYASSYGLLGALCKFRPYIISVWGSDVYEFGEKGLIQKGILKYNFKRASRILSTSKDMARQTKKFTSREIGITPFGVDPIQFHPSQKPTGNVVIGTVKGMSHTYGIDLLIHAFSRLPENKVHLKLAGTGPELEKYKQLATELQIDNRVNFIGHIEQREVPDFLNSLNIFVAPSRAESFGVSVVEASACGLPVVTSDVGGLPEVVVNEQTGFIVKSEDIGMLTQKIQLLIDSEELRKTMGMAGREFILKNYVWEDCVSKMISEYQNLLK